MRRQQNITQETQVRTRLAPTPSGYLHLGNALSFAITWALARQRHGTVILRIDDLDNARFRPEYLQDVFDTLQFMGLDYDEGPGDAADFMQHYSQHMRLPAYEHLLEQLVAKGVVYACPCSRKQLAALPAGANALHACQQERLPLHLPDTAWRIQVPAATGITFNDLLLQECTVPLAAEVSDFVVRRKEGLPAYQVASLSDDLAMGVNLVVRGADLLSSTAAQLFLAQQLGAESFARINFLHHPVVSDPAGGKLSKSHDALSIAQMRRSGLSSKAFWQNIAATLGWKGLGIVDAQSFLENFRLENLPQPGKYGLQVSGYT